MITFPNLQSHFIIQTIMCAFIHSQPWLLPCHHSTRGLYSSVRSLRQLRKSSCLMPRTEPEKKIHIRVPLLHSVQGVEPGLELDRTMGERVSLTVSSITSGGTCKVEISWSYGGAGMESSKCETTCQDPLKPHSLCQLLSTSKLTSWSLIIKKGLAVYFHT